MRDKAKPRHGTPVHHAIGTPPRQQLPLRPSQRAFAALLVMAIAGALLASRLIAQDGHKPTEAVHVCEENCDHESPQAQPDTDHAGHDHAAQEEDDDHTDHDHATQEEEDGHDDDNHAVHEEADDHAGHDHAAQEVEDDHAGHDHAAEAEDDHAGHDHAAEAEDDHAGHDHAAEAENAHAGHDHAAEAEDDHAGHDHATETEDAHAGHDHAAEAEDAHAGHDHGHEEGGMVLSAEERRNAGIVTAEAGPGDLKTEISMAGEVALNEDRLAHVLPLVGGVVREVSRSVGEVVSAGEVLATIDSSDLGEAKLDYLTKLNELGCCNMLVPRAQAVHDNTTRLLAFLAKEPLLQELQGFDGGETGENLSRLVDAYAEQIIARQTFERDKRLFEKKIGSEQEYLEAKTTLDKALAKYVGERDSISFAVKHELAEGKAARRRAEFEVMTSARRLRLMGVADDELKTLNAFVQGGKDEACSDPNCPGCKAAQASREEDRDRFFADALARHEVRSPIAGVVVEKHIVRGENVSDESDVFTVANIDTVWVNLTVHLKDVDALRVGQEVTIRAEHSGRRSRARIGMVSPLVDESTRTATARITIDNEDGAWRPGMFVVGHVSTSANRLPVVIPKAAVQTVDGETVVFVPDGDKFEAVPVKTGRSDRTNIEITRGLRAGTKYVAKGSFALKAKLVTSNLDPHAGHGH